MTMCGINGVFHYGDGAGDADGGLVEAQATALRHRGPDDWDVWCEGPVALAQRRLSIVDLSAGGHQPQAVSITVGDHPVDLDVVLGGAGRLAGAVRTADGTPVRDAIVTLTDVRGDVVATSRSGREGAYVLAELVAEHQRYLGRMLVRSKCAPHFMRHVHQAAPDSPVLNYETR